MESIMIVLIIVVVVLATGIVVREYEVVAQRKERHKLKSENAALRLQIEMLMRKDSDDS